MSDDKPADEEVTVEQLAELNQVDDTEHEADEKPEGLPTELDGSDIPEGADETNDEEEQK